MESKAHQQMVKDALKGKFYGHDVRVCKNGMYPQQLEREYQRITNAYVRILNKVLQNHLPDIRKIFRQQREIDRTDADTDLYFRLERVLNSIDDELIEKMNIFNLKNRYKKLCKMAVNTSKAEWERQLQSVFGQELSIDLFNDYYNGEFYEKILEEWLAENMDFIKTIPKDSLSEIRQSVLDGFRDGKPITEVVKAMQKTYTGSKSHARFIARDQIAKLNSRITKKQQEDAGVEEYVWSTSGDVRVRQGHAELNNTRHKWTEPPIVDETGRRCHPGEDFQCRCVALPVFDIETIDLPIG